MDPLADFFQYLPIIFQTPLEEFTIADVSCQFIAFGVAQLHSIDQLKPQTAQNICPGKHITAGT